MHNILIHLSSMLSLILYLERTRIISLLPRLFTVTQQHYDNYNVVKPDILIFWL